MKKVGRFWPNSNPDQDIDLRSDDAEAKRTVELYEEACKDYIHVGNYIALDEHPQINTRADRCRL